MISDLSTGRVLGVFAKEPVPGRVKTRLAASVTPAWAAQVAEAFLRDTLGRVISIEADRFLYFSPPGARPFFEAIAKDFVLTAQADGDLGRRMAAFFSDRFGAGAGAVVLIGSDSPTLPVAFIEQAFVLLRETDIVLGPATDGGYYLIGCAREFPGLFDEIHWGTSAVLHATVEAAARSGYRVALLPPWYDVDTLDDWRMLQGHIAALRYAGIDPGTRHIERLLRAARSG